jgi:hypothetical protein
MHLVLASALLLLAASGVQEDARQKESSQLDQAESVWEYLTLKYDANHDGRVSQKEYTRGEDRWKRLDKDADGFLVESEFASEGRRGGGRRGGGGDRRGPGGGEARPKAPKVGEVAPDFNLLVLPAGKKDAEKKDDKTKAEPKVEFVKLSGFKNKKPVALIFGSYT